MSQKTLTRIVLTSALAGTSFLAINSIYSCKKKSEPTRERVHPQHQIVLKIPYVCTKPLLMDEGSFNNLASILDLKGNPIFDCKEIEAFNQYGGTVEYAKELASMRDLQGEPFFSGYDIVAFKSAGGTVEYAKTFLIKQDAEGHPFSGSQLAQLYALGLHFEEAVQ